MLFANNFRVGRRVFDYAFSNFLQFDPKQCNKHRISVQLFCDQFRSYSIVPETKCVTTGTDWKKISCLKIFKIKSNYKSKFPFTLLRCATSKCLAKTRKTLFSHIAAKRPPNWQEVWKTNSIVELQNSLKTRATTWLQAKPQKTAVYEYCRLYRRRVNTLYPRLPHTSAPRTFWISSERSLFPRA